MILTETVMVKWAPSTKKHYESLGYKFSQLGDSFKIPVSQLSSESHYMIEAECDCCGKIKTIQYRYYLNNFNQNNQEKYLCSKCMAKKEEIVAKKINKARQTCLERYGVENPSTLKEFKEKSKQTCLQKYGVEYIAQTEQQKKKAKETLKNKYGVDSPLKDSEILKKSQQTCLKNYGVDNPLKSEKIKEKIKNTNLEKYGVETALLNPEIKEKTRATTQARYGVDCSLSSKEVREKGKETLLKKYGVENPGQSKEIQEKMRKSLYKHGKVRTSKQQKQIYDSLKELYGEKVILNYPLGKYSLDCFLELESKKIDIEYDGWYWHQFILQEDKERDKFVFSENISIIRIKAGKKIPTKMELQEFVNQIIKNGQNYFEKIYPEWEENVKEKDC